MSYSELKKRLQQQQEPIEEIDPELELRQLNEAKHKYRTGRNPELDTSEEEEGLEQPFYMPDEMLAGGIAGGMAGRALNKAIPEARIAALKALRSGAKPLMNEAGSIGKRSRVQWRIPNNKKPASELFDALHPGQNIDDVINYKDVMNKMTPDEVSAYVKNLDSQYSIDNPESFLKNLKKISKLKNQRLKEDVFGVPAKQQKILENIANKIDEKDIDYIPYGDGVVVRGDGNILKYVRDADIPSGKTVFDTDIPSTFIKKVIKTPREY